MKHRRSRPESDSVRDPASENPTARAVADDADAAPDDGAPHVGPHHDPSIHTEREPYAVTTQRCRGEYP
ncbi:MAG TPA: hypothetical protein VFD53_10795 [Ilumatobacter sp.]|nr:hypothetical protein [Ilumatobacter sp.]